MYNAGDLDVRTDFRLHVRILATNDNVREFLTDISSTGTTLIEIPSKDAYIIEVVRK